MRWVACAWLSAVLLLAAEPGYRAWLEGGTNSDLPNRASGRIEMADEEALLFRCRQGGVRIPYSSIHALEYGQHVSRRYAEAILISPVLLLSKSRRHFVTISYLDDSGRQQALVFRVDKHDVRPVLAALEARTGRRVEYQDEEARRSGRG